MHPGVAVVVAPGVDVLPVEAAVGADHRHQIVGQLEGFVLGAGAGGGAHFHLVDAQAAVHPGRFGVAALVGPVADRVAVGGGGQIIEAQDAAVVGVGHVEVAVQVGAHAARAFEVVHVAVVVAEAAQHVVQGELAGAGVDAEDLDAVVAVVRHVQVGGAVVRRLVVGHPLGNAVAVPFGGLAGVVIVVGGVTAVVLVHATDDRAGLHIVAAFLVAQSLDQAYLVAVVRINAERLDPVVELIGNVDKALRRDRHVARQVEVLAAAVAGPADGGDVFEVAGGAGHGAEEVNLLAAHVVDVEAGQTVVVRFAFRQEGDAQGRADLRHRGGRAVAGQGGVGVVQAAHQGAVQVQHLDFVVAHVGHVDPGAAGAAAQRVAVIGDRGGGVELVALLHRLAAEFRGAVLVGEGVEGAGGEGDGEGQGAE